MDQPGQTFENTPLYIVIIPNPVMVPFHTIKAIMLLGFGTIPDRTQREIGCPAGQWCRREKQARGS